MKVRINWFNGLIFLAVMIVFETCTLVFQVNPPASLIEGLLIGVTTGIFFPMLRFR